MSNVGEDRLYQMRHSAAHVLAMAVLEMFPEAKLAFGPPVENGFYYDFDLPRTLIPEDLKLLEKRMKQIQKNKLEFVEKVVEIDEARSFLEQTGQIYKIDVIDELKAKGEKNVTFYENVDRKGDVKFVDLCKGGHTEHTGDIGYFKLAKIAGAYFKGDESNKMLQRVYGYLFETKDELSAYLEMLKEAEKRDHRKIGAKLDLFTISDLVGAGLPLLKPNGMIIRQEVENYLWNLHKVKGYQRVWTPHIAKMDLYETSGHAAKFGDELFKINGMDEDNFCMKPMNCPHHMQIFADNHWSYRDMPVRYFEPATVYRNEKSGQLSGLTRVRAITQDDGHLFCRPSQIENEVAVIVEIVKEFYGTLGMADEYWISLSVRDPESPEKYLGEASVWDDAEKSLEDILVKEELNYKRIEGEAAFYGPKLDFMFKDAIGREWQLATIQLDFQLPERFDLTYINEDNEKERPVVIHRAISGSLERFMGVMIEHFAGIFPLWLAPRQIVVVPVIEKFEEYGREVLDKLLAAGLRAEIDSSGDSLGKRIRNAEKAHINYILVVGEEEMKAGSVSVRNYKTKNQEVQALDAFVDRAVQEYEKREL